MDLQLFGQQVINGVSLGALYGLIAVGYTMVSGIIRPINFAHGDIVMMSCYFAFFGYALFNLPWWSAFLGATALTTLLGILIWGPTDRYGTPRESPPSSPPSGSPFSWRILPWWSGRAAKGLLPT